MSSIIEKTFPAIKKLTEEKGEQILYLRQNLPKATHYALDSEIRRAIGLNDWQHGYEQGDIRLVGIHLLENDNSLPTIEYVFTIQNSILGLAELETLLKKYGKNVIDNGFDVFIPKYESGEKIGGLKIRVGDPFISIETKPNLQNFLSLAKEMESIVHDVYGKNTENQQDTKSQND